MTNFRSKPKPPATVSASAGTSSISVTWPTPPTAGKPVGGFILYRNGTEIASVSAAVRSYADTGAAINTSTSYVVETVSSAGVRSGQRASNAVVATGSVKFNPGHYMSVYNWNSEGDTPAKRLALYDSIASESCIKGVNFMTRWGWKECESSFGVYTLDWLQTELDYLHASGKKMLLWFGFGRWGGTGTPDSEAAYPSYAATGYSDSYSSTPIVGVNNYGAIYKSWNTAVNARLNALFIAIGQRFDSHPALEGFCPFQESAFNVDGFPGAGHEDALRASIITTLQTIKPYFPTTVVYTSMSWLRQIGQVFPTL